MFPAASSSDLLNHQSPYDFTSGENEGKWKGIFVTGLKKVNLILYLIITNLSVFQDLIWFLLIGFVFQVMYQVGPSMKAKEDAFEYLEKLIIQLLGMICSRPSPHSVQEVQDRIQKLFPPPIDGWVIDVASQAIKQGKKKHVFPVEKIHPLLKVQLKNHKLKIQCLYMLC